MIIIPFIYFSFLSLILYRRHHRFDIATIISVMYAVCGAFSIMVDMFNLRSLDVQNYTISPTASFFYCGMITINLLPFIKYSNINIERLCKVRQEQLLKILAYASFAWFLFMAILSFSDFLGVLTGDIGELRAEIYRDERSVDYISYLPLIIRIPFTILNVVFGCPWVLLFMAFFCRFVQKLPSKFFWLFLIASLSGPWTGVLGVDRSKTTYWIISFGIMFYFFKPYMIKKQKRLMFIVMTFLIGLVTIYISMVTNSRFGDRDYGGGITGNLGGIISYLGQNYINFCYFFDTFDSPLNTLSILFPFTYKYILGEELVGGVVIQEYLTYKTGVNTGVFYTYLGQILISAGLWAVCVFCLVYSAISLYALRRLRRKSSSPIMLYMYITLSSIMFLGAFVHYYSAATLTFSVLCFMLFIRLMGSQQRG